MRQKLFSTVVLAVFAQLFVLSAAPRASAQKAATPYPGMDPLSRYLMADRNAEIALARSAAPESVSAAAEVLVLGSSGYENAVKGKNGFVCMVERSWSSSVDDPEFWNPKRRGPVCMNAAAARSYLPIVRMRTSLVLAGKTKAQMVDAIEDAFATMKLPAPEPGAMCYMMSKEGYLNDRGGRWHPHVMFYLPQSDTTTWGANLAGSPVLAGVDPLNRLTVLMIPVARWSDGTPDSNPVK